MIPKIFDLKATLMIGGSALVIGLASGFGSGYYFRDLQAKAEALKLAQDQIKAERKVNDQNVAGAEITNDVAAKAEIEKEKTRVIYRDIEKAVPIYIPAAVDIRYDVPLGFVHVWNATASGDQTSLSGGPSELEAEPSGVPFSEIATAHAEDIEYCRTEIGKYHSLWEFNERQKALAKASE